MLFLLNCENMRPLSLKPDLHKMSALKIDIERKIKEQCSSEVIDAVYKEVFSTVRSGISVAKQTKDAVRVDAGLGGTVGTTKSRSQEAIENLRRMVDSNALERELQNALVQSGLLTMGCEVVKELSIKSNGDYKGMRFDVVLGGESSEIIELKRANFLLLARRVRLSRQLVKAIQQAKAYRCRISSDVHAKLALAERFEVGFNIGTVRLIVGRRPEDSDQLGRVDEQQIIGSEMEPRLLIYTWDSFLDELQRIYA